MAFTPSPDVARDAAKRLGADRTIIFYTLPSGRCGYASYGQNLTKCREARTCADALCASSVVHLWDAPEVARQYLATGEESLREAATAARSAAATARSAARSAKMVEEAFAKAAEAAGGLP